MKVSAAQKTAIKTLVLANVGGPCLEKKYGNSLKNALQASSRFIGEPWNGEISGEGSVAFVVKCAVALLGCGRPFEELVIDILAYCFDGGVREFEDTLETVGISAADLFEAIGVPNPYVQDLGHVTINVAETCPLFSRNGERVAIATKGENGVISVLPEVWAGGYFLNRDQYLSDSETAINDSGTEDESGLWKYEIETKGKRTENVTGMITVDSIAHGKKHVEEVSAQSAIRCGEKLTGRAWLLRLNGVEVPFTVSTVRLPEPKSELHGVPYTPAHRAKAGDIVRGPKILFSSTDRSWNPKTHPGTQGAWLSVEEMVAFRKRNKMSFDPAEYIFRITVCEYEVGVEGDNNSMKGWANFWNQHVTDVRRDPYSDSLINDLK